MKNLYIIGAAGFGREVAWIVEQINKNNQEWNILGFIDDNQKMHGTLQSGYPVIGGIDILREISDEVWVICTIGMPKIKKKIMDKIKKNPHLLLATLVAPTAIVPNNVKMGKGSIIASGSILSVDVEIGNNVIINMNCTVGHDTILNDYVTLRPSVDIAGNVNVESCADIGIGAQVIQNLSIGENAIIGAGAVVIKDVLPDRTVVGVPARLV